MAWEFAVCECVEERVGGTGLLEGRAGVEGRDGGHLPYIVDMVRRTLGSWRLTVSTGCRGKKKSWCQRFILGCEKGDFGRDFGKGLWL